LKLKTIGAWSGVAAFALLLLLPAPEGLGPAGMRMAAVASLMAIWWVTEAAHIAVTALLPLALFPLLGILPSQATATAYANHLVYLYLGGFIIALAMEKWNLHKRIALLTIRRIGTRTDRLILGFMATTAMLSMWISNTATTMMFLPVSMAVVNQLAESATVRGRSPQEAAGIVRSAFGSVLLLGIAYAASIGGVGTIIGTPTNVAFVGFASQRFPELPAISFIDWLMIGLPLVIVFLPIAWLYLCRFGAEVPMSHIHFAASASVIEEELRGLGPMKPEEKRVLLVASATAMLWIFRTDLVLGSFRIPGWNHLMPFPDFLHDATVAMLFAIVLCVWPRGRKRTASDAGGSTLIDWKTIQHGVPWGVVLLFGGGFALAQGLEVSGLAAYIGQSISGLRGMPVWVLFPVVCIFAVIMTEMTSNVATVLMITPILAEAALQLGIHPYLLMIPATIIASFAFMLPVATPPNAIVFSSGWITVPRMFKAGVALDGIALLVIPVMVYVLGRAVLQLP
jgi:solute carrier family 13 (sodium-dependent dicarboxylate transporter), member 2/3/5